MSVTTISASQFAELYQSGQDIELIDVRTPVEYRDGHLDIAHNVPMDQLDPAQMIQSRSGSSSEPLYFICRLGRRSQQACEKFLQAGITNVVSVEGGTRACIQAGLPVVCDQKAISLDRQVRIASGLLVLIGLGLGIFSHEGWLGLAGIVGAGLVFAGITDTCGMGMMLLRMPWNRCETKSCQSSVSHERAQEVATSGHS